MSALDRTLRPVSYRLFGKVVAGFQRGSKDLGWPTANLDPSAFESQLNDSTAEGVYIGWAAVSDAGLSSASQQVHKAVLSIGWNPFYKNEKRTVRRLPEKRTTPSVAQRAELTHGSRRSRATGRGVHLPQV